MRFCDHCGAQIQDGTKFCPECGQKIVVKEPDPPQQSGDAFRQTYTPPAQQSGDAFQQTYTPPAQQPYGQQAQQSGDAFQQPYTSPAQQPNVPPTQADGGSNVRTGTPAGAPKEKKPGKGKKIAIFAAIGVVVVAAIVVALVLLLGGKGENADDPNLGRYEGVSCVVADVDLGAEGEWIELKAGGKADVCIMGSEFSAKWSLDGETFTLNDSGSIYKGTLKDGVLTLDFYSMVYTFRRDGASAPTGEGTTAREAGYWTLLRVESDTPNNAASEEDIAILKEYGIEIFMDLQSDGTGAFVMDTPAKITWGDGKITAVEEAKTITYTLQGDLMVVEIEGDDYIFTRGQGSAPKIDWSLYAGGNGGENPGVTVPTTSEDDWWSGKWYGWIAITNGSEDYEDSIGNCDDCVAVVDVYGDGTGYVDLTFIDGEELGWASVSFGAGTTENGCMMSESGSILDAELAHGDWIVDPAPAWSVRWRT